MHHNGFISQNYNNTKIIDLMQLRAYLIRNQAPHVINSHVHLAVAILSGEKIEVVR